MKTLNSIKPLVITSIFVLLALSFVACSDDDATEEEIAEEIDDEQEETIGDTDYDISSILSKFDGTGLSYAVNGNTVTFTTDDLPNHTSPYWPTNNALYEAYNGTNSNWNQNPNEIVEQNIVFTITLNPEEASNKEATGLGPIGISRNGVVFFINNKY